MELDNFQKSLEDFDEYIIDDYIPHPEEERPMGELGQLLLNYDPSLERSLVELYNKNLLLEAGINNYEELGVLEQIELIENLGLKYYLQDISIDRLMNANLELLVEFWNNVIPLGMVYELYLGKGDTVKENIKNRENVTRNNKNFIKANIDLAYDRYDTQKIFDMKVSIGTMVATLLDQALTTTFASTSEPEYEGNYKDYYSVFNIFLPTFRLISDMQIDLTETAHYFKKKLVNDFGVNGTMVKHFDYKKYNLNDDDTLFCFISCLYKTDFIKEYNYLPRIGDPLELLMCCGFHCNDYFNISRREVNEFYRKFSEVYNLDFIVKKWGFVPGKAYNQQSRANYETYRFNNGVSTSLKSAKCLDDKGNLVRVYKLAFVRGHYFNISIPRLTKRPKSLTQKEVLDYFNYLNYYYDFLEDKNSQKELLQKSRYYSHLFSLIKEDRKINPERLIELPNVKKFYSEKFNIAKHHKTPKKDGNTFVFIYDYETFSKFDPTIEQDRILLYSYFIMCTSHKVPTYLKNSEFWFGEPNLNNEVVKIEGKKIIKIKIIDQMIRNYVYELVKFHKTNKLIDKNKSIKCILLAHNGARFDNVISRDLCTESKHFYNFSEICTGPNNSIMLSLECTYDAEPFSKKDAKNKTFIELSFRDSMKILGEVDGAVKKLPDNFGTTSFKLEYDMKYYDNLFRCSIPLYKSLNNFNMPLAEFLALKKHEQIKKLEDGGLQSLNFIEFYLKLVSGKLLKPEELILHKDGLAHDIDWYIKNLDGQFFDPVKYCFLYNKYDVITVKEAIEKINEYLNSIDKTENILSIIENSKATDTEKAELIEFFKEKNLSGLNIGHLDVTNYRSVASMVFDICVRYGVFDDIYILKGGLKEFVQLSVVGGKVQKPLKIDPEDKRNNGHYICEKYNELEELVGQEVNTENLIKVIQNVMNDCILNFDGVSLYPSAIYSGSIPTGPPTIFNHATILKMKEKTKNDHPEYSNSEVCRSIIDYFNNLNYKYYVCCDVTTHIDKSYPILSKLVPIYDGHTKVGYKRSFENGSFNKIVVGEITLKDAIEYQNAEITELYSMVVWKTQSKKFSELIEKLFMLRLIFKKLKLQVNNTIKLIMNSAFGRTILRDNMYDRKYARFITKQDQEKFKTIISKKFHKIKPCYTKLNGYNIYEERTSFKTLEGYPHIGSTILEQSKHLMNKIFNIVDQHCYYTDTDSLHIMIGMLKDLRKTLGKDIIGEDLCMFHSDFESKTVLPLTYVSSLLPDEYKSLVKDNLDKLFAIQSVYVMKKCYIDELFGVTKEDYCKISPTPEEKGKVHFRYFYNKDNVVKAKGFPKEAVPDVQTHLSLLNGKTISCDIAKHRSFMIRKKDGHLYQLKELIKDIRCT